MKNIVLLVLVILIAAGCKKSYQCMHPYYNRPLLIGLTGFQRAELQTVEVKIYKADGLFDSLLATKTYTDSNFYFYGDTAEFAEGTANDYIISIPATGSIYHLSHMTYNDTREGMPYTRETPCNNTASVRPPDSITINSVRYGIQTTYNSGVYDILLIR